MKQLFTLLAAMLLTAAADAQIWTAGLRGGLTVSSVAGEESEKFSMKPGFTAGFFTEYRLGVRGGVFLDLLYSQKGGNYEETQSSGSVNDARLRLDYIDVPLAVIFYPVETFGFYAGPQVSILAYSKLKTSGAANRYDDIAAAADYGVVGGFRLRPTERLSFDLRYNYGFSDLTEFDIGLNRDNISIRDQNHAAYLMVGYVLFSRMQ